MKDLVKAVGELTFKGILKDRSVSLNINLPEPDDEDVTAIVRLSKGLIGVILVPEEMLDDVEKMIQQAVEANKIHLYEE